MKTLKQNPVLRASQKKLKAYREELMDLVDLANDAEEDGYYDYAIEYNAEALDICLGFIARGYGHSDKKDKDMLRELMENSLSYAHNLGDFETRSHLTSFPGWGGNIQ